MVNSRLCETARLVFFSARPRLFEFLDCKTKIETPKWLYRKIETAKPVKFD